MSGIDVRMGRCRRAAAAAAAEVGESGDVGERGGSALPVESLWDATVTVFRGLKEVLVLFPFGSLRG